MITLATEFIDGAGGFSQDPGPLKYKQMVREGMFAVYQRFYADGTPKDFETIFIKVRPKGTAIFKNITEDDEECYPPSSSWGHSGWSFHNLGAATNKMKELIDPSLVQFGEKKVKEVKPPKIKVSINVPVQEFSTNDLAEFNKVDYQIAALFIKDSVNTGTIKFVREERRNARGKMTKVYSKTS